MPIRAELLEWCRMRKPRGANLKRTRGSVIDKPQLKHFYILFYYLGVRVEIPLEEIPKTEAGRSLAERWLDTYMPKIDDGSFRFAEALPGAKPELIDKFRRLEAQRGIQSARATVMLRSTTTLTVKHVAKMFLDNEVANYTSKSLAADTEGVIKSRIIPYFGDSLFDEIKKQQVVNFLAFLRGDSNHGPFGEDRVAPGKNCLESIGRGRVSLVLRTCRDVWRYAFETFDLDRKNPFDDDFRKYMPEATVKLDESGEEVLSQVWMYDEVMLILDHIHPHYVKSTRAQFLTGSIISELAGLRNIDVNSDIIRFQNFITIDIKDEESVNARKGSKKNLTTKGKPRGKKVSRKRKFPLTAALLECFDQEDLDAQEERRLFSAPKGGPLRHNNFHDIWTKALKAAGLPHRSPYSVRHTFTAWAIFCGLEPKEVAALMGHKNTRMFYEVYGRWRPGLQADAEKIRAFFGEDFVSLTRGKKVRLAA